MPPYERTEKDRYEVRELNRSSFLGSRNLCHLRSRADRLQRQWPYPGYEQCPCPCTCPWNDDHHNGDQARNRERYRHFHACRHQLWRNLLDRKSTRLNSSHLGISYAV